MFGMPNVKYLAFDTPMLVLSTTNITQILFLLDVQVQVKKCEKLILSWMWP